MEQSLSIQKVGRLPVVLVCRDHSDEVGVISDLHASFSASDSPDVAVVGEVRLEESVVEHLNAIVLPLVCSVADGLGLSQGRFMINLERPAYSSVLGRDVVVEETSLGPAAFLAMVSAVTQIRLPQDTVVTGHISSSQGDLSPVEHLDVKLRTVIGRSGFVRFLHPPLDDPSVSQFLPRTLDKFMMAVAQASHDLYVRSVGDVFELVEEMFSEASIIRGAVLTGFFQESRQSVCVETPVGRILDSLTADLPARLWQSLNALLRQEEFEVFKEVLDGYLRLSIRLESSTDSILPRLMGLIRALPPSVKRRIHFEDETLDLVHELHRVQGTEGSSDLQAFERVVRETGETPYSVVADGETIEEENVLDEIIVELRMAVDETSIEEAFLGAYRTFVFGEKEIATDEDLEEEVSRFLIHLKYQMGESDKSPLQGDLGVESRSLVEESYANHGGWMGAVRDSRQLTHGGLSGVLKSVALHLCRERVNRVRVKHLKSLVAADDFETPVRIMAALKRKYGSILPREVMDSPDEAFAKRWVDVLLLVLSAMDAVSMQFSRGY